MHAKYRILHRPLHLAIIHENVNLTRYIIRLVKGVDVQTNLDMPNNMRQARAIHLSLVTLAKRVLRMLYSSPSYYPDCWWDRLTYDDCTM